MLVTQKATYLLAITLIAATIALFIVQMEQILKLAVKYKRKYAATSKPIKHYGY